MLLFGINVIHYYIPYAIWKVNISTSTFSNYLGIIIIICTRSKAHLKFPDVGKYLRAHVQEHEGFYG